MVIRTLYETLTMKKISCQTSTINPSLILRENPINNISTLRNLQLIEEHGHTHIIRNPHNEKNIMSNVNNQPLIDFTRKPHQQHIYTQKPTTHRRTWSYAHYTKPSQ